MNRKKDIFHYGTIIATLVCATLVLGGCFSQRGPSTVTLESSGMAPAIPVARQAPGTVEYVWEEPMTDVVDVPPGLDPEGVYYRPGHQEVVEIRQGRWKYYRQPGQ